MTAGQLIVLYHAQCRDGWAAAWAAKRVYPDAELRPAMYGTPPPSDLAGRKILLVDFSYPREHMMVLADVAHVRVLDHHKTAQAALDGLQGYGKYPLAITFDMERSGAGIAWDELCGDSATGGLCVECAGSLHGYARHDPGCPSRAPWIIRYVEDRDLWRFALPDSREVNAFISTLPYGRPCAEHLDTWTAAAAMPLGDVIEKGRVALEGVRRYAEAVCENAITRKIVVGSSNFYVPSVNAPQHEISEVLEHLMDLNSTARFVHGWWQRSDGLFAQSFRSRGDDCDVSEIAKTFGGGGHKNAAGAQTSAILGELA